MNQMNRIKLLLLAVFTIGISLTISAKHKNRQRAKIDTGLRVSIKLSDPKPEIKLPPKPTRNPDSILYWKPDLNFTWDEFWGKPDIKKQLSAYTSWGIILSPHPDPATGAPATVSSVFYKYKSWKNPKKPLTTALLIHEKVHFNIAELYARKMRKAFSQVGSGGSGYEINTIYQQLLAEMNKMQVDYDKETDNSKQEDRQREWNMKISTMMSELSLFGSK